MKDKINVAELLRYCPSGMELDCSMWDNLYFDRVEDDLIHCYYVLDGYRNATMFLKDGCYTAHKVSKCVIFPKGKNSWEGFVPPCKFKDGDIIFTHTNTSKGFLENSWVSIFKEYRNNRCACYVCLCLSDLELYHDKWEDELLCELCEIEDSRIATEEEKAKLFDVIMANGYRWNGETKTLKKLVEPIFKVGDKVKHKCDKNNTIITITGSKNNYYYIQYYNNKKNEYQNESISFTDQDKYELVIDKFDINNLKPFDKVLMRSSNAREWVATFYSHYNNNKFYGCGMCCSQCIPYEENKHLLGTTDDCKDFFKNWQNE
jgi:hypothetical protein